MVVPRRGPFAGTFLVATLVLGAAPPAGAAAEPEVWARGLAVPVDLAFGPDGTLYYAELQTGKVRTLDADGRPSEPLATVPASPGGNGGFLGLTADPERAGVLYAYYSMEKAGAAGGKVNRVVRLEGGRETVLLDDIPWNTMHDGGRLVVAPDGYLYVTVGDADGKVVAQDERSLLGKVLRMTRDGQPAPGNPEGWNRYAFAKGFRNPFGIAAAEDGRVYVSDNGGQEEVNLVQKGANYGWPSCTGPCRDPAVTDPLASWDEHFGPTGVAVHGGTLFLTDVAQSKLRAINRTTGASTVLWQQQGARLLDVEVGPDGCLYVSGWEKVWRFPLPEAGCGTSSLPASEDPPPKPAPVAAPPPAPAPALPPAPPATPPPPSDEPVAPTKADENDDAGGTAPTSNEPGTHNVPGVPLAALASALLGLGVAVGRRS